MRRKRKKTSEYLLEKGLERANYDLPPALIGDLDKAGAAIGISKKEMGEELLNYLYERSKKDWTAVLKLAQEQFVSKKLKPFRQG